MVYSSRHLTNCTTSFIEVYEPYTVVMDFRDRTLYIYSLELIQRIHVLEVPCMKKIPFCILWCYYIHCNLDIEQDTVTRRKQVVVTVDPGFYLGYCLFDWV